MCSCIVMRLAIYLDKRGFEGAKRNENSAISKRVRNEKRFFTE
jgi:hypothetical protein